MTLKNQILQYISPHFYLTSLKVQEIMKLEIRDFNLQFIFYTCSLYILLALLLNEINSIVEPLDPLKSVVSNIQNVTLLGLKRIVKSYLMQKYSYYCVIPNCYVCQRYLI